MTVQNALALLVLAAIVAGVVLLIRSGWPRLRMLGWTLVVVMLLFGGLIVLLTQGSPSGLNPDWFYPPQDKVPDGGLELAVRPPPSVTP
jgi:ABC-type branched-subunit amino acid transport system permease subunit